MRRTLIGYMVRRLAAEELINSSVCGSDLKEVHSGPMGGSL